MIKISFFLLLALASLFCLYSCYFVPYTKEFKQSTVKVKKEEEPIAKKNDDHVKVKSRSAKHHTCGK